MSFLEKLRKQPERNRKIILWATIGVIGSVMAVLWADNIRKKIENFQGQNVFDAMKTSFLKEKGKEMEENLNFGDTFRQIDDLQKQLQAGLPLEEGATEPNDGLDSGGDK